MSEEEFQAELLKFAVDLASKQKPFPPYIAKAINEGWAQLFD